jgi:hypothetical protein
VNHDSVRLSEVLSMDVYLRRKDRIYGPLEEAKLLQLAADRKLAKDDVVSTSSQGPWEPVATAVTRLRSRQAQAEHSLPGRTAPAPTITEERLQLREAEVRRREERSLQFEQRLLHREEQLRQWEERLRQSEAGACQTQPAPAERFTPAAGGLLRVQRKTGVNGLLMKIQVLIDGEMKAQLAVNATVDIHVDAGRHVVEAKGGGAFGGARHEVAIAPGSTQVLSVGYGLLGKLQITAAGVLGGVGGVAAAGGMTLGDAVDAVEAVKGVFDLLRDD